LPTTTKYSAGYLQRKKMFSSKKENKDLLNLNPHAHPNNNAHAAPTHPTSATTPNQSSDPSDNGPTLKRQP
jgi:hypothetical protein